MLDLTFLEMGKKCYSCAYPCETGESYCSICGENLKQRTTHFR